MGDTSLRSLKFLRKLKWRLTRVRTKVVVIMNINYQETNSLLILERPLTRVYIKKEKTQF